MVLDSEGDAHTYMIHSYIRALACLYVVECLPCFCPLGVRTFIRHLLKTMVYTHNEVSYCCNCFPAIFSCYCINE